MGCVFAGLLSGISILRNGIYLKIIKILSMQQAWKYYVHLAIGEIADTSV